MRSFVLDACAAIDYLQAGPGAAKVEQLLAESLRQQLSLSMSVLNLGEVYYLSWMRNGEENARRTITDFSRSPVQVMPVDFLQALKAAELKALHKIPFVDCVAAALAAQLHATLVTSDRDFEKLGRQFPILWLPRR